LQHWMLGNVLYIGCNDVLILTVPLNLVAASVS
jgi:hypothetical protein